MSKQDAILVGLWTVVVGVGFYLQPFFGVVLAVAVLGAVSYQRTQETQRSAVETQLAGLEASLRSDLNGYSEKLDQLIERFTQLRADEHVHRSQQGSVPRLRG